jgi:sugar O-acyltransferase (sialic acid O-acetyltransferase NeuD family)
MAEPVRIELFGAGPWAREALAILADPDIHGHRCKVVGLRDNDPAKHGTARFGLPISPADPVAYPLGPGVRMLSILTHIDARIDLQRRLPDKASWATYIHASTCIRPEVTVEEGVFIAPQCHLAVGAHIGPHCRISYDVLISEDVTIESHSIIQPRTFIGGEVQIGPRVRIGAGAMIRDRIRLGEGCQVAMGAVVVRDVPPGAVVAGNPARIARQPASETNA